MRFLFLRLILLQSALIVGSCATTTNQSTPPENYHGPIAAEPVIQQGDYWIYERGNSTRAKSTRLLSNIKFPLWIGKSWRYDIEARRRNQPTTSTASPIPAWAECRSISAERTSKSTRPKSVAFTRTSFFASLSSGEIKLKEIVDRCQKLPDPGKRRSIYMADLWVETRHVV